MQADAPTDLVELGRIVSAYGVRGWIKVQPHSQDGQVLLDAKTWWLKAPAMPGALALDAAASAARPALRAGVKNSRPQGSTVVAELDRITDRDHAETFKGYTVWVPRADFPLAADDEYYWVDLIGCRLFGESDAGPALIGAVLDVLDNGAHAVLRVGRLALDADGKEIAVLNDKGRQLEVLVPFVSAHVHGVDLDNKRLDSNWPVEF
ncbi:MAG: ribosome maturation factor RimM [Burkholderiaceae bacterium]